MQRSHATLIDKRDGYADAVVGFGPSLDDAEKNAFLLASEQASHYNKREGWERFTALPARFDFARLLDNARAKRL